MKYMMSTKELARLVVIKGAIDGVSTVRQAAPKPGSSTRWVSSRWDFLCKATLFFSGIQQEKSCEKRQSLKARFTVSFTIFLMALCIVASFGQHKIYPKSPRTFSPIREDW
jgi:hypothetical protein